MGLGMVAHAYSYFKENIENDRLDPTKIDIFK